MFNPVDQDHWSIIVFRLLKLLTHQLDKVIQLEGNIPKQNQLFTFDLLGIKTLVNSFFDRTISDVRIFTHFCVGTPSQENDSVKDVLEVFVL